MINPFHVVTMIRLRKAFRKLTSPVEFSDTFSDEHKDLVAAVQLADTNHKLFWSNLQRVKISLDDELRKELDTLFETLSNPVYVLDSSLENQLDNFQNKLISGDYNKIIGMAQATVPTNMGFTDIETEKAIYGKLIEYNGTLSELIDQQNQYTSGLSRLENLIEGNQKTLVDIQNQLTSVKSRSADYIKGDRKKSEADKRLRTLKQELEYIRSELDSNTVECSSLQSKHNKINTQLTPVAINLRVQEILNKTDYPPFDRFKFLKEKRYKKELIEIPPWSLPRLPPWVYYSVAGLFVTFGLIGGYLHFTDNSGSKSQTYTRPIIRPTGVPRGPITRPRQPVYVKPSIGYSKPPQNRRINALTAKLRYMLGSNPYHCYISYSTKDEKPLKPGFRIKTEHGTFNYHSLDQESNRLIFLSEKDGKDTFALEYDPRASSNTKVFKDVKGHHFFLTYNQDRDPKISYPGTTTIPIKFSPEFRKTCMDMTVSNVEVGLVCDNENLYIPVKFEKGDHIQEIPLELRYLTGGYPENLDVVLRIYLVGSPDVRVCLRPPLLPN